MFDRFVTLLQKKTWFLFAHIFINLIGIFSIIIRAVSFVKDPSVVFFPFYSWVLPYFFPQKPLQIAVYFLGVVIVFLLICKFLILLWKRSYEIVCLKAIENKRYLLIVFFIVSLLTNLSLCFIDFALLKFLALAVLIWGALFIIPFVPIAKGFYYGTFVVVFLQFFLIFQSFVFGQLRLINELWDIPEKTIIFNKSVDNIKYINEHKLLGFHNKYDFRNATQNTSVDNNCVMFPQRRVQAFLASKDEFRNRMYLNDVFSVPVYYYDRGLCIIGMMSFFDKTQLMQLSYTPEERNAVERLYDRTQNNCILISNESMDEFLNKENIGADKNSVDSTYNYHLLCVTGKLSPIKWNQLVDLGKVKWEQNTTKFFYEQLNNTKIPTIRNGRINGIPSYYDIFQTTEVQQFLKVNLWEMHSQVLNRYFLQHQNFILAPINELNLGKDKHKIYFQYGYLNTLLLQKLMNFWGGISYHNYIKISYSFYYFYYSLFILVLFIIFRDIKYVVPVFILSVAALNKLGYLALVIAPGINPLRHFFDVFVILFCFLYWQRKNWIYFGLAYIFSLIEIFNNSLFGIFILGALLTVFLIKSLVSFEKIWCSVLLFGGGLLTGGVVYQLSNVGIDPMMLYYFKGLAGFLADYRIIFLILFVIGSMYLVLVKPILTKDNFSYFVLFLIIYAQGMLFYYIWGSDLAHFLVIFPIIFFAIFVFVKLCIDHYGVNKAKSFILDVIFMASIILYVPSVVNYYLTKTEFDNIFATHVVYKWNMPTARFISTMDPTYFTDSINLIKAYSTDNSIYIISKYDNFLPFLAQKYSAMPYFDTSWFLMSDRELQKSIAVIKENKPKYLFVDSDINRSYALDIIDGYSIRYYDDLYYESLWRFIRLDGLKKIFYAIENDYRPIKKAYLLTVYERVKK